MDVVLYARISQDRTGGGLGTGRQLADLRALAERNGDHVVAQVDENDRSAYFRNRRRPGFDRVVEMVKAGEVQGIYAWHPDRLYRSLPDLESLVDLVDAHHLEIRTCQAGHIDLSTASGRMIARMLGSTARFESEHKAERQARKHDQLASLGKPSGGGRRPMGYQDDRVTVEPVEAAALQRAAESILSGHTLASAARAMSETLGRTVRPNILRNTLTGPRVAGQRQHIPAADRRRGVTTGTLTPAVWPAILDSATWQSLRVVLLDPRRQTRRPPRDYLLSGIVTCGHCGTPMCGGAGQYKCSVSSGGCARMSVTMTGVDDLITRWVQEMIDASKASDRAVELASRAPQDVSSITSASIAERKAQLAEMFAEGAISATEWRTARDRLDTLDTAAQEQEADRERTERTARDLERLMASWEQLSVVDRRRVVSYLLDRIVIEPRTRQNGSKFDDTRVKIVRRGAVD